MNSVADNGPLTVGYLTDDVLNPPALTRPLLHLTFLWAAYHPERPYLPGLEPVCKAGRKFTPQS
ncbi:MAG: hypothetical protein ACE5JA_11570 [bacterium]